MTNRVLLELLLRRSLLKCGLRKKKKSKKFAATINKIVPNSST